MRSTALVFLDRLFMPQEDQRVRWQRAHEARERGGPLSQRTFANWECPKIVNAKKFHYVGCGEDSGVQSTGFIRRVHSWQISGRSHFVTPHPRGGWLSPYNVSFTFLPSECWRIALTCGIVKTKVKKQSCYRLTEDKMEVARGEGVGAWEKDSKGIRRYQLPLKNKSGTGMQSTA